MDTTEVVPSNELTNDLNRGKEGTFDCFLWDEIANQWIEFRATIPLTGTDHLLSVAAKLDTHQLKEIYAYTGLTNVVWAMALNGNKVYDMIRFYHPNFYLDKIDNNPDLVPHTIYLLAFLNDGRITSWLIARRS